MKKYMDKLKTNTHINKNLFVFLLVLIIIGIISGSLFSAIIDSNDKKLVTDYINNFFQNIKTNKLSYETTTINTLIFTIGFALIMWLLGISIIGFFIVIFMLFLKGFILGFTISSIIQNLGIKGILIAFTYSFPHHIINILIFILITAYALIISFKLIRTITSKKTLDMKQIMHKYTIILIIAIITLTITSLYEVYIMPKLLNFVLNILKL